jgi:heme-degrading monooxygenase HmoA
METKNPSVYTLGTWTIKAGKESTFVSLWTSFAQWMNEHTSGLGKGHLLQDAQNPAKFISIGSWDDVQSIQAWRDSDAFRKFVGDAMPLCDDFQPNTLNLVADS